MNHPLELIIDNFAGGGGASLGIELALSRSVDVAINHDPAFQSGTGGKVWKCGTSAVGGGACEGELQRLLQSAEF